MTSEYGRQKWGVKKTPGMLLGRYCQALIQGKGFARNTIEYARGNFGDTPQVVQALEETLLYKAAVDPGTGTGTSWAQPLVLPQPLAAEFTQLIHPLTVIDRVPFSKAPFSVSFGRSTSGAGAGWVGENQPIAISRMSLDTLRLGYNKLGSICVISNELASFSGPQAATIIANDLARSAARYSDRQLLDPGVSAVIGTSPQSITFGAQQFVASGNSFANVVADLKLLMKHFTDNEIPLSQSMFIMSERVAVAWATLTNTNSDFCFENLGVDGGDIFKIPVITTAFGLDAGSSPSEEVVTLLHPDSIAIADGGVAIDIARQGSLVLDSAPNSPAQLYSLFQNSATGLRCIRYLDYIRRRDAAVACLTGINL